MTAHSERAKQIADALELEQAILEGLVKALRANRLLNEHFSTAYDVTAARCAALQILQESPEQ